MVNTLSKLLLATAAILSGSGRASGYFLFSMNDVITTERIDPIVSPGKVAGHTHTVVGGSNFRVDTNTSFLRQSECTSSPIKEDNSNYWAPTLYFQWKNGSFTSVTGNPVMYVAFLADSPPQLAHTLVTSYYLFSDTPGVTTPFPDDFRMISGTPTLRSYDASSYAQQAVTFLCLDFSGTSTKYNQLPVNVDCPSGIRAQINFPSCWDGVNSDSVDHKSHVAFLSGGPDSGTCSDPKYPKTLPRIFMEMYLDTSLYAQRSQAMNPAQPFVYAMGDPTGYGYHADFMMGWKAGVLQNVVDKCHCNEFGDPTCCSDAGIFTFQQGGNCRLTKAIDETTTGTLPTLPGNNPVVPLNGLASSLVSPVTPAFIEPVYAYTGDSPTQTGKPVGQAVTATGGAGTTSTTLAATSSSVTTVKTTSTKAATSTNTSTKGATTTKGNTTTKTATTAPASGPTSGSGSGSGSGSAPASPSGSGASNGSGSSSSTPANGSSSGSGSGGSPATGSSPSSGPGSSAPATGAPATGAPATGAPATGAPANGSAPGSSKSSGDETCHKKAKKPHKKPHTGRSAVRHARSTSRRFATPSERFILANDF
ncbi:hypothetical protein B0H16DRAFT_1556780 [Mycena metata]|uniref:DUF1996 domain-containing protein n=1 Tax=Mycena metata TaxID=1033252 RepID=A0AAD7ILZ7_9AGAR|nr:hypothetical protein B0H16DRAFT_1556780 [Mycena metata]